MKLSLSEFIHRLIYLIISITWTFLFFWFMEQLHGTADRTLIFITGIIGFIILGRYDIKVFKGRWI